ncbi:MAG: aldo/keto reductase [Bacilli bacterium]
MKKVLEQDFVLANGVRIPKLGFGTWQIPEGEIAYQSVLFALKHGYRHIDTAHAYENEKSVGKAIRDSAIPREEIFVTTKLPSHIKDYEGAKNHLAQSLANLDIGYIDLYLIHAPWPWSNIGQDCRAGNGEVWRYFEEAYEANLVRSIGVSNFNVADLENIFAHAKIRPMVNQIAYFIGYTEDDITKFCQDNNVLVEGYSPLATGRILNNPEIQKMADKYRVTLPQLCIRYLLEHNVLPLPKSTHENYIIENSQLDFKILAQDLAYLDQLHDTVTKWN